MKQSRRLLSLAVAAVAGLAASLVMASPASAHHATIYAEVGCAPDGQYAVWWSVANSEDDIPAEITSAVYTPAGHPGTGIVSGATIPADDSLEGVQYVPSTEESASLTVEVEWIRDEETITDGATKTVKLEGTCEPAYTVTETCDTVTFHFIAPESETLDLGKINAVPAAAFSVEITLTPSTGTPKTITLVEDGDDQDVSFPASTGMTVEIAFGDPVDFTTTYTFTHAPCPLPLTGGSISAPLAIGGGLLLVGVALIGGLFLFRRRRTVATG